MADEVKDETLRRREERDPEFSRLSSTIVRRKVTDDVEGRKRSRMVSKCSANSRRGRVEMAKSRAAADVNGATQARDRTPARRRLNLIFCALSEVVLVIINYL